VELIERGLRGPLTVAQRADLTRIRRSQEYMLGLMNNVLDYLKLGAGSVRYRLEAVAVEDAMIAAGELIWPILHAGDLHFDRHGDGADVRVHADREKLQQVVLNLLANAAKFTAPGGRVELDWAVDADTVAISVRDTGCGIPADRLESVFDAFVRLDGRGARPASGTGLGLTISRELVAGMGGRLVAESEVGTGSVFTVILPRSA
jgi:signal transduction histidine kinase